MGCVLFLSLIALPLSPVIAQTVAPTYSTAPASRDGIGKIFMGREIAHVMGHQAADWLERPERFREERPDLLITELDIKAGMTAAYRNRANAKQKIKDRAGAISDFNRSAELFNQQGQDAYEMIR